MHPGFANGIAAIILTTGSICNRFMPNASRCTLATTTAYDDHCTRAQDSYQEIFCLCSRLRARSHVQRPWNRLPGPSNLKKTTTSDTRPVEIQWGSRATDGWAHHGRASMTNLQSGCAKASTSRAHQVRRRELVLAAGACSLRQNACKAVSGPGRCGKVPEHQHRRPGSTNPPKFGEDLAPEIF